MGTKAALETLIANTRKPTAIVTFNDYVSTFAIKHAKKLDLIKANNLEFVSYANTPMINFMENRPVASIEQFPKIQAQRAIDVLFDLLNKEETEEQFFYKIIIESELVENH
jgi:LacI family repressor for deo operon, udp, cdd, tsx, nupC, and nupG